MHRLIVGAALAALAWGSAASAQVTGIVTAAQSTIELTPNPSPTVFTFNGTNLAASRNDDFSSGGSFAATSDVAGDTIVFQNGNVSAGVYATTTSFTSLDITFKNGGAAAIQPMLHSSITPAGLGLYIGEFCGQGPVQDCGGIADFGPLAQQRLSGFAGDSLLVARSSFFFDILSDNVVIYSVAGSVSLIFDIPTDSASIVTDLADASARLTNFSLSTLPGDPYAFGFAWDETGVDLLLADLLAPGDSRVLTYRTGVQTYTRNSSFDGRNVVAYAGFGDPIGRGGSIPPPPTFAAQSYELPTFDANGNLDVTFIAPGVPEPASWALMLGGFGLAGTALRRRRTLATA